MLTRDAIQKELEKSDFWGCESQPDIDVMVDRIFDNQEQFGIASLEMIPDQGNTMILAISPARESAHNVLRLCNWATQVFTTTDPYYFSNPSVQPERDDDGNLLVWLRWD